MTLMAATDRTRSTDTGEVIKLVIHHTSDGAADFTLYDRSQGGVYVPLNLSGLDRATAFFWYQDAVFTSFDLDFTIVNAAAGMLRLAWTNAMTATLPNVFESMTAQIVFEFAGEAVKVLDARVFILPSYLSPNLFDVTGV